MCLPQRIEKWVRIDATSASKRRTMDWRAPSPLCRSLSSCAVTAPRRPPKSGTRRSAGSRDLSAASATAAPTVSTPLVCLLGFKNLLVDDGMQIFESTEIERLEDHTICTHAGSILLGGGTPVTAFRKDAYNSPRVIERISREFRSHFPGLKDLSCIQF